MRNPGFGELNVGALAGVIVGSIGGLFAPGLTRAIYHGDFVEMFSLPTIGVIAFVIGGAAGYLFGGQIGPRFAERTRKPKAELAGGALGGLVAVIGILLWSWYQVMR